MVEVAEDLRQKIQENLALERSRLTRTRRKLFMDLLDESKSKAEIEALEDSAEKSANRILQLKDALERLNRKS